MNPNYKIRRFVVVLIIAIVSLSGLAYNMAAREYVSESANPAQSPVATEAKPELDSGSAVAVLSTLPVKGRAPKTNYSRAQFGNGWESLGGCDLRNLILQRDLRDEQVNAECKVLTGVLNDPYTGNEILFVRGETTSDDVQIDHVVALSNSWQTGAQMLSRERRVSLANDPLNLLAVDGGANQQKSDSDAATWLPANKSFRCQYVARQVAVKQAYSLWVTPAEYDAMSAVLQSCPGQALPVQ